MRCHAQKCAVIFLRAQQLIEFVRHLWLQFQADNAAVPVSIHAGFETFLFQRFCEFSPAEQAAGAGFRQPPLKTLK